MHSVITTIGLLGLYLFCLWMILVTFTALVQVWRGGPAMVKEQMDAQLAIKRAKDGDHEAVDRFNESSLHVRILEHMHITANAGKLETHLTYTVHVPYIPAF